MVINNIQFIKPILAADPVPKDLGNIGGGIGLGPFGKIAEILIGKNKVGQNAIIGNELNAVISILVGFLTTIAAIWFIIRIILGGIQWLSSGGDQKGIQNAQQTITNAIIGLAIVVAAYAIISVISSMLGLTILNPAKMLNLIK